MTDRFMGFVVVLNSDIREDDAKPIIEALKMIKGVDTVEPVTSDIVSQSAIARAKAEIRLVLYRALESSLTGWRLND